jgi:enamine deaminase RidA (YjgF/YER057c/UK114 family)
MAAIGRINNLVFTAGQLPMVEGSIICAGILGNDVEIEEANKAAQREKNILV